MRRPSAAVDVAAAGRRLVGLGGTEDLGAALTDQLLHRDWLRRTPTHRTVRVTETGRAGLADTFGLQLDDADTTHSHSPSPARY